MFDRAPRVRVGQHRLVPAARLILLCCAVAPVGMAAAQSTPSFQPLSSYEKWTLFCTKAPSSSADCALAQAVQDESDSKTQLRISIAFDKKWDLLFKIRVEPKPVESEGVALLIDGIQSTLIEPKDCDSTGCSATFYPSTVMLARLLRGTELEGQFRTEPEPECPSA
jgi:invasion protein IalB